MDSEHELTVLSKALSQSLPNEVELWNLDSLLHLLQDLNKLISDSKNGSNIGQHLIKNVICILQNTQNCLLSIECLKVLRNYAAGNLKDAADSLDLPIQKCVLHTQKILIKEDNIEEEELILTRISLQFLGNLINNEPKVSHQIWLALQKHFESLLLHKDEKIGLYSSFVLYGILRNCHATREEILSDDWKETVRCIISSSHRGHLFSQFSVQLYLKQSGLLPKLYRYQTLDSRLFLLHQVADFISESSIDKENLMFLTTIYQDRATVILHTCDSSSVNFEAIEVASILEIMAKASVIEEYRCQLQSNLQLVSTTIDLLKAIFSLGQSASNYFSVVKDHFETVEPHPAINFRGNLVRLLGNLSYQNTSVQDLIRESDAIAPILECSNLDARNPFIQQWSILAIRNLCEKNKPNQELIASLTYKGVVQPSVLEILGMIVEKTPDGMKVRSIDANKKD